MDGVEWRRVAVPDRAASRTDSPGRTCRWRCQDPAAGEPCAPRRRVSVEDSAVTLVSRAHACVTIRAARRDTWLLLLRASLERSFFSRSWMRASLEPWMSSSVEREDDGRGATDFFRMGLGRLEGRNTRWRGDAGRHMRSAYQRAQKEILLLFVVYLYKHYLEQDSLTHLQILIDSEYILLGKSPTQV